MVAPRVILTRPAGQSRAWHEVLQSAGHEVQDLPLIETSAVESTQSMVLAWQQRSSCRAWMFVSGPAVANFFACRPAHDTAPLPRCWATGPGTRRALNQCGVPDDAIDAPPDHAGQFDTEHLWEVVRAQVAAWPAGQTVVIVRGTEIAPPGHLPDVSAAVQTGVGRDWLAEQLATQGVQVRWVVAYRRGPPAWDEPQRALARQAASDGSIWVFSSSLAVRFLAGLMPGVSWAQARAVATHDRIALVLRAQGWGQVSVCKPQAGELSLHLASLESPP